MTLGKHRPAKGPGSTMKAGAVLTERLRDSALGFSGSHRALLLSAADALSLRKPSPSNEVTPRHELKVWPMFYDALAAGIKTFEVRFNDRNFKPGQMLRLREYSPQGSVYSGRECHREIAYVLSGDECPGFGVEPGYVVLGLQNPQPVEAALEALPSPEVSES